MPNKISAEENGDNPHLSESDRLRIETWVMEQMEKGDIPGLSIVILEDGETSYKESFGYANLDDKKKVTSSTLFELGSTTKAFTALGILKLQEEGKLNLKEPVTNYLEWFEMKYNGDLQGDEVEGEVTITLEQLLYHTSGIGFNTIGDIPIASGEEALEMTVRTLIDQELSYYPGEVFEYASINYDVLGLIIEEVTGQTYEEYIVTNILNPLNLKNSYFFEEDILDESELATGYKMGFLRSLEYDAPTYRGNTPAGYLISNIEDVENWLKIQMGVINNPLSNLIKQSHIPNRRVPPSVDGSSYAAGWSTFQEGAGIISHEGSNPNYSSYIEISPEDQMGVAVLANLNSSYTAQIGQGVIDLLQEKKVDKSATDIYKNLDNLSVLLLSVLLVLGITTLTFFGLLIQQLVNRRRIIQFNLKTFFIRFVSIVSMLFIAGYYLYKIPEVFFDDLPWEFLLVWGPKSFPVAICGLLGLILLIGIYYLINSQLSVDLKNYQFFTVAILSILSGLGNALIIFVVNETLYRSDQKLFMYFALGIFIYIICQKLVMTKLLKMTNQIVYKNRINIINKILGSKYQKIESIERGKIQATLNNDTETISDFANLFVSGVTSLITLICCFFYLGVINFYGLLLTFLFMLIAATMYFLVGRAANMLWEDTRTIQNKFFQYIEDLLNGFKELKINRNKKNEFVDDIITSCRTYKDKRIAGDLKFANVFVIGELLFVFVIGAVVFIFPLIFVDIQDHVLRSFVFVLLYMTGPLHGVLDSVPQLLQVRISWNRLKQLEEELDVYESEVAAATDVESMEQPFELEFVDVSFAYKNLKDRNFTVGPINTTFKSGEITFITGGNGSGKSTLAKLITGLYTQDSGKIMLNGFEIKQESLAQQCSAVFSDFHLFEKLYGVNVNEHLEAIEAYSEKLKIKDKFKLENKNFNTIALSTGQRKRLALLISYLEDRPVYLFDEWAADQDPEFREFFYEILLPELKEAGKCIVAITHDDKYFHLADKELKIEMGRLIEKKFYAT